jgi:hypothetical protein
MRFGYSPGWLGRSPTGLPPTAQWLMQSGLLPQYTQWLQSNIPATVPPTGTLPTPQTGTQAAPNPFQVPFVPQFTGEQEKQMLEQQIQMLESQMEAIKNRLEELNK